MNVNRTLWGVMLALLCVALAYPAGAQAPVAPGTATADCSHLSTASACERAGRATVAPSRGPRAQTTEAVVCIWVVTDRPSDGRHLTEVVWMQGDQSSFRTGRPIAYQRRAAVYLHPYPDDPRYVVVQSCIPRAWLQRARAQADRFTVCNGAVPNEGASYTFTTAEFDELLRVGRVNFFSPLSRSARANLTKEQALRDHARFVRDIGQRAMRERPVTQPAAAPAAPVESWEMFVLPHDGSPS